MNEEVVHYIYVLIVSAIGGIVGYFSKNKEYNATLSVKIAHLLVKTFTAMFVGYVAFEIAMYSTSNYKLSAALAGVGGFAGADLLIAIQDKVLSRFQLK